MRNICVVGGLGFVGSHLTRRLVALPGIQGIRVFDNLSSGKWEYLNSECEGIVGDAADIESLRRAFDGCDTVFHLAANPDISRAVDEPTIDFDHGTLLTRNVCEAARKCGVSRVIYFSGSGVYGDQGLESLSEDSPCQPISAYGAAKLAGEAMMSAYSHMFGIKALAFRFANIVGPRQTHGVGYDFIRKLKANPRRLMILGNGFQSKSYIHVDDVLNAVLGAINRQDVWVSTFPDYDVFNVAASDYLSVHRIAEIVRDEMGIAEDQCEFEFSSEDRGWKGDVPVVRFNCAKIQSLGWRCERNSEEAMRDAVQAMIREAQ